MSPREAAEKIRAKIRECQAEEARYARQGNKQLASVSAGQRIGLQWALSLVTEEMAVAA